MWYDDFLASTTAVAAAEEPSTTTASSSSASSSSSSSQHLAHRLRQWNEAIRAHLRLSVAEMIASDQAMAESSSSSNHANATTTQTATANGGGGAAADSSLSHPPSPSPLLSPAVLLNTLEAFGPVGADVLQALLGARLGASASSPSLSAPVEEPNYSASEVKEFVDSGRVGPAFVLVDSRATYGTIRSSSIDPLECHSISNFSSCRANVCVHAGRWMYEVVLGSSGILQLGWALRECPFVSEKGVGDAADSYAYDGSRVRKWNIGNRKYGQQWTTGDVIGCTIDLDEGIVEYYRNGVPLGPAFKSIRRKMKKFAYFPAVSISKGEKCQFNFGATPFQYPLESYQPLQAPPSDALLADVDMLLDLLRSLSSRPVNNPELCMASIVVDHLLPRLRSHGYLTYVIAAVVVPFLAGLSEPQLHSFLSLCSSTFSTSEFSEFVGHCMVRLTYLSRTLPLKLCDTLPKSNTPFVTSDQVLALTLRILRHFPSLQAWMANSSFEVYMEYLFQSKRPTNYELQHWFSDSEFAGKGDAKDSIEEDIGATLERHLDAVQEIYNDIATLFTASPVDKGQSKYRSYKVSPRARFMIFLRWLIRKNKVVQRNAAPPGLSDTSVLINVGNTICGILQRGHLFDIVGYLAGGTFPLKMFIGDNPAICPYYSDLQRVGGLLSHVTKIWNERQKRESANAAVPEKSSASQNTPIVPHTEELTEIESAMDLDLLTPMTEAEEDALEDFESILRQSSSRSSKSKKFRPSSKDRMGLSLPRSIQLLDCVVLLFYFSIGTIMKSVSAIEAEKSKIKKSYESFIQNYDRISQLSPKHAAYAARCKQVLDGEYTTIIRRSAWVTARHLRSEDMAAVSRVLLGVVEYSAASPDMFPFLPSFYIDVLMDMVNFFRFGPLSEDSHVVAVVADVADFMSKHLVDENIVVPDVKESMFQCLYIVLNEPSFLREFETHEATTQVLVKNLMKSFHGSIWIRVLTLLLIFWRDTGFGERLHSTAALLSVTTPNSGCASEPLQKAFRRVASESPDIFKVFFNNFLNNLNWAFTEFGVSLNDTTNSFGGVVNEEVRSVYKRCLIMFHIVLCSLRLLEYLAREAPELFLSSEQRLNLNRVSDLAVVTLSRVTTGHSSESFNKLLDNRHDAHLDKIERTDILSCICGLLLALDRSALNADGTEKEHFVASVDRPYPFQEAIAKCDSFSADSMRFLLLEGTLDRSLPNVTEEKLAQLRRFVDLVVELNKRPKEEIQATDEAELCPICYAAAVSAKFVPCGHTSCQECISRHLLNSSECFFCKKKIERVDPYDDRGSA